MFYNFRHILRAWLILQLFAFFSIIGCGDDATVAPPTGTVPSDSITVEERRFLDTLQRDTFDWFWETTNPQNGLTPDRAPNPPFSSIAATGFALSSYIVGSENGYITRSHAAEHTLTTLEFFWDAPMGPQPSGVSGYKGFYYHFLKMDTGHRFQNVELSTIDSALLFAGMLSSQEYFDKKNPTETRIRALADSIYSRAEWTWFYSKDHEPLLSMGYRPGEGFLDAHWQGYNEAMILYILALGSPTHPIKAEAWNRWTDTYEWETFHGQPHVNFTPLFGHQYSHIWVDFRGIQDAFMRRAGIDYFENSRRATIAQREYAIANPNGFRGYGKNIWGLTASDGPADITRQLNGQSVQFHTYWARGASALYVNDDGTIAPTAAGGSMPFTPVRSVDALYTMKQSYGERLYGDYGFRDAFNPSFRFTDVQMDRGDVVDSQQGWFNGDYLGIDQGPILLMVENYRSGLIWELMKENPYIRRGLERAGFENGWLEDEFSNQKKMDQNFE
ncbi:hypothetical protein NC796_01560 [Aliifodinibius sp. S!AR15-10]|uniref:glucoamylase family protein n=1 Tax=Aliifodinibius sp. S!AR15-10 TaxID=2950437 RepID=UPI00286403F9|nr:glucoamylase family protein [Aliifodinibius sp. S!AR15-10]MDR8389804.1 hypothetical protein [Aliifodinibius sp. S!AR15-10]